MKIKKLLSMLCVAAMTMGLLAGCGGSETTEEASAEPKTFTMAVSYIPENFLPTSVDDTFTTVLSPIYDKLYYTVKDGIEYRIADSVEVSEDGLTYTVKLNDNASWSDGEPITTKDLVFTINYDGEFGNSSWATINGEPVTLNEIDEKTLEIVLPSVNGEYLNDLGGMYPMPSHVFENDTTKVEGSDYFTTAEMVTSGAYTISEINADSIVFAAKEDYYRGTVNVDQIVMKTIPESSTEQIAFENNELSYMKIKNMTDYEKYAADTDNYNMYTISESRTNYLHLNPYSPLLESVEAREAVFIALNNTEIVEAVYGSDVFAVPANSDFNPDQTLWSADWEGYEQDLERAKELAEKSGLAGKTLKYMYATDRANMEETAVVIQQQLEQIGVNVEIEGVDMNTLMSYTYAVWYGTGLEAEWDLATNGYDSMRGAFSNYVSMSGIWMRDTEGWSEDVEGLCFALRGATTEEDQKAAAKALHDQMIDECRHYPISYTNINMVSHKNVTGLDSTLAPEFTDWLAINIE